MRETYLLLHNIRSTYNVGSMFRTADAAGVSKIFLSGYTPQPIDRFGRVVKELSKVALGGENSVPWEYVKNPHIVLKHVRDLEKENKKVKVKAKTNAQIVGIEQEKKAVDYKKVKISKTKPVLFIVGNEVDGISKGLLKKCDVIAEIPMNGKKESLNVSVSLGIALFRILNI